MKQLINRSYEAIKKRGLIEDDTHIIEFIDKMHEEFDEVLIEYNTDSPVKKYIEECVDLATVCIMQIHHLGYDFIKEFEKVVIKNENRK